jgi:hypothetical protein
LSWSNSFLTVASSAPDGAVEGTGEDGVSPGQNGGMASAHLQQRRDDHGPRPITGQAFLTGWRAVFGLDVVAQTSRERERR